jgi:chemotaxis signal transduction protein
MVGQGAVPMNIDESFEAKAEPGAMLDRAWEPLAESGEAGAGTGSDNIQRMCVSVGDLGLLFASNDGREVIAPPVVSRIPYTASWLRGFANVRGELVPVVDTAAAFGASRQAGASVYLLIFGHGETSIGLLIDGLPRLADFGVSQRLTDRPALPPLLQDSVIAAYEHAGRVWLDIDLNAMFDALARHIALA